ncbi:hypothetical protein ILYODFUR_036136 [Ilyodon furcidens]|uniref:Uncharacterized protein n=1 Tax=Ilyodon furcidens TaxID=33524 RepID=A0ABV0VAT5_9TELE
MFRSVLENEQDNSQQVRCIEGNQVQTNFCLERKQDPSSRSGKPGPGSALIKTEKPRIPPSHILQLSSSREYATGRGRNPKMAEVGPLSSRVW